MRTGLRLSLLLLMAGVSAGCASSARHTGLNSRLITHAVPSSSSAPGPYDTAVQPDSLETVMGKIRELSARANPRPKRASGSTLESFDRTLEAAVLALKVFPTAETHRRVASEYARLGVFDAAHRHYRAAIAIDSGDAAAYDGLARLWRDAGLPALALGDAHRAAYFAPSSAEAHNTLGTVLQALGQNEAARRAYAFALLLQPEAAYALNNLGYLSLIAGHPDEAAAYCRRAITVDGRSVAAHHNLALAYAASGRMDLVRQTLRDAGSIARADYNEGIINLSLGKSLEALAAFEAACRTAAGGPADSCDRARALRNMPARVDGGTE